MRPARRDGARPAAGECRSVVRAAGAGAAPAGVPDAHPALSVELVVRDTLGELVAEGFDAAVRFGEPEPSGLVARKLLETRILTCASPAYLDRHGTPLHPRDLERHQCLMFRDPVTGRPFGWEYRRAGEVVEVKANGRLVLNDLATKLAACAAGNGHRADVEFGLEPLLASEAVVQILPGWAEERYALYALSVTASVSREGAGVPGFRGRECGVVTDMRRSAAAECEIVHECALTPRY